MATQCFMATQGADFGYQSEDQRSATAVIRKREALSRMPWFQRLAPYEPVRYLLPSKTSLTSTFKVISFLEIGPILCLGI